jgi:hypothetical protein
VITIYIAQLTPHLMTDISILLQVYKSNKIYFLSDCGHSVWSSDKLLVNPAPHTREILYIGRVNLLSISLCDHRHVHLEKEGVCSF